MVGMSAEERRSGLYAAGVEAYRVRGTTRRLFGTVWCHLRGELGTGRSAMVSVFDDGGCLLFQYVGLQGGVMKAVTVETQCVWADMWVQSDIARSQTNTPPEGSVLRPQSAAKLHLAVSAKAETQPQLWVVAQDDEVAAYVRSVRAEYPSWRLTCVREFLDGVLGVDGVSHVDSGLKKSLLNAKYEEAGETQHEVQSWIWPEALWHELSRKIPPAMAQMREKAVAEGRTELLFVYSGQGAKLDGWWLD
eukprot:1768008-Rhodomonas_salina.1